MTLGCFSPNSCLCKSKWQAFEKEGIKGYIKTENAKWARRNKFSSTQQFLNRGSKKTNTMHSVL